MRLYGGGIFVLRKGLYGYSNDVIKSGCEYTKGKNDLFSHLVPTIENVSKFIAYIHKELGIL